MKKFLKQADWGTNVETSLQVKFNSQKTERVSKVVIHPVNLDKYSQNELVC
jgi:hypothetical protein